MTTFSIRHPELDPVTLLVALDADDAEITIDAGQIEIRLLIDDGEVEQAISALRAYSRTHGRIARALEMEAAER